MRVLLLSMFSCALWAQAPATAPAKPAAAKPRAATPAKAAPVKRATAPPAAASAPASGDPVVITVGGETITKSQFEEILKTVPANAQAQVATPAGKRQLAEQLVEVKTLAQEARRRSLDQQPTFRARLKIAEDNLLASALYQTLLEQSTPSEAAIQKYYDEHKNEYETAEARHILIRFQGSRVPVRDGQKDLTDEESLAKAKQIRDRIVKGEDFAAVAKAESDDAGSGAQGGNLGEFGRGRMVPVFDQAVFSQPIGDIGEPVKSQFGYHLIQVQKRTLKPLAEVKDEIAQQQKPEGAKQLADAITGNAKSVLDESYFGSAPQPAQPAAPAEPKPQQ